MRGDLAGSAIADLNCRTERLTMDTPHLQSLLNRHMDGLQALFRNAPERAYRTRLLSIIDAAKVAWKAADYGSGYLYQSFPRLGLRGFRQTEVRARQMNIGKDLAGRSVLEIGCNSGFLSFAISDGTRRYLAFDNNPFLIDMAELTQNLLGDTRVEFRVDTMEAFETPECFEVVLSFANHSTWDGNMQIALGAYFAKLQQLLVPAGLLYFESHHPVLENPQQLKETLDVLTQFFDIEEQRLLTQGSAWDRGRTFIKARSRRQ